MKTAVKTAKINDISGGIKMGKEQLFNLIEKLQGSDDTKPVFTIGEQLKDIAAREPISAELLEKDLVIKEMSLEAAEKKLKEYADKHHKGAGGFCISPKVAEKILREFYGLPEAGKAPAEPAPQEGYIDLSEFL
jgi:hypothetical protein